MEHTLASGEGMHGHGRKIRLRCPHSAGGGVVSFYRITGPRGEGSGVSVIESLAEYLMITQDAYRVEQYIRQPDDRWLLTDIRSLETSIELASMHCELAMSDIYNKVRARDSL